MREILFRGKRADNGEWVEGFPFVRRNTNGEVIDCFIIQEAYEQVTNGQRYVRSNLKSECFRVIPKTIRQFTGLTDKNGKKIFEGDIVKTQEMYDRPFSQKRKSKRHIGVVEYKIRSISNFFNPKTGNWERHEEYSAEWIVNVADYGRFSCSAWGDFYECEVIGNIHDNPELLKGGAEE